MTNKIKQEELHSRIKGILFDLTDFSIYRFETQEETDEAYATVAQYEQDAIVAIEKLINRQVLGALAEVKNKLCYEFSKPDDGTTIDGVIAAAIEEIESKYQ